MNTEHMKKVLERMHTRKAEREADESTKENPVRTALGVANIDAATLAGLAGIDVSQVYRVLRATAASVPSSISNVLSGLGINVERLNADYQTYRQAKAQASVETGSWK